MTATCRRCGCPLEYETSAGWVDARSGDDGGTYDWCPAADTNLHVPGRTL